jgi:hypothetical protein
LKLLQPRTKPAVLLSVDNCLAKSKANGQSLQMRILNPLWEAAWDQTVCLHREAGCFHTSAWARVLRQTYNHKTFYLQYFHGRTLVALIPLIEVRSPFTGCRGVCLPFSDACEPLIFDPDAIDFVTNQLVRFARERRWKYIEIRGGRSLQLAATPAAEFYGHTLELCSGAEKLITRFASPVRRAIRKAERSGVNALVVRNRQAIDDFYQLHVQTRRRHGLPPQPRSFFLNIYEHCVRPGLGFIVLARHGSRSIAAAIFLCFGKNALYKYGASDKRFQEFRANNLVMWHGIQVLANAGAEKLHFGRTDCENDGLRRFKLSWGTEEQAIQYFRVDPFGREYVARGDSAFHKRIFCRLPLAFNRLAGSMIYPHLD